MLKAEQQGKADLTTGEGIDVNMVRFARFLRANGLAVAFSSVMDAVKSVGLVDISKPETFRMLLRCHFVSTKGQFHRFDELFRRFWLAGEIPLPDAGAESKTGRQGRGAGELPVEEARPEGKDRRGTEKEYTASLRYSPWVVNRKDRTEPFAFTSSADLYRSMVRLLYRLARMNSRRYFYGPRGRRISLKRVMKRNLRFGGEPVLLDFQKRKPRRRQILFFCDASGSMDLYTLMAFQFIHVLLKAVPNTEVFFFSTQLTRVTGIFRAAEFSETLQRLPRKVADWGGGTRIGHCLESFTRTYAGRLLTGKTIVMIYSDGWDRGETGLLEEQMARVKRKAHRVLWINPLAGTREYEPVCRGMQAALPYVDHFLPATHPYDFHRTENILFRMLKV